MIEKTNLIPFNEWSQNRIDEGKKHCTSRHKRYPNDPRVDWISPKLPWWFIRKYLWEPEGANSPGELQEVIEGIYKREVLASEEFYVHFGIFTTDPEKEALKKRLEKISGGVIFICPECGAENKVSHFSCVITGKTAEFICQKCFYIWEWREK